MQGLIVYALVPVTVLLVSALLVVDYLIDRKEWREEQERDDVHDKR